MPGPKFSLDWSTFFFFWKFGFSSSTNNYFTQISRKFWTENIFGRMATAQKFPPYFPSYHLQRQFIARNVLCIGIDEAKLKRNNNIGVHQSKIWITIQTLFWRNFVDKQNSSFSEIMESAKLKIGRKQILTLQISKTHVKYHPFEPPKLWTFNGGCLLLVLSWCQFERTKEVILMSQNLVS